jgi:hypothetical protein
MNKEHFTQLLEQPETLSDKDISAIKKIVDSYPYFQSARALYLKTLKNTDSYKYNNALKKTAAFTTDRSVLFDFITSAVFNQNSISQNIKQNSEFLKSLEMEGVDDISVDKSVLIDEALKAHIKSTKGVFDPDLFKEKEPVEQQAQTEESEEAPTPIISIDVENITAEEQLELGKPLEFDNDETHSFAEWLKITNFKPIDRRAEENLSPTNETQAEKTNAPIASKLDIIDKFIANNPKIIPAETAPKPDIKEENSWSDEGLMTETLARIYLEQKNYQKAIQSYKILSLKYPEKSSFFANQIKAVEELQSRNN